MADDAAIEAKFWKALTASPIVMLGLNGTRDGKSQPMTAFFEQAHDPLWFYTSTDNALYEAVRDSRQHHAIASYTGKGHDLFASLHGMLDIEEDRAVVDRFWNRDIAAWYEGGRSDPRLAMLRLDADSARIWLGASAIVAPIRRLLGKNPRDYAGKVTEVLM